MKLNTKFITSVLLIAASISASAQTTRSAYFTDNYLYRFEMNPAMGNDKNFIALPILGNVNGSLNGNLGLEDIFYNVNGKTTTFLNSAVDSKEFLDAIGDNSKFGTDLKLGILSVGFKGLGGYNTIAINGRFNGKSHIPNTFLQLLKEGLENKTYDISNLGFHADAYAELALGHSHDINDKIRVGGTVKFLIGGGNFDAKLNNAKLHLGEDKWLITVDGQIQANIKDLEYNYSVNETTGHQYVDGADIDNFGISGYGAAVDLGVEYKVTKDLTLSASVVDLGFINWSNNMKASTNGEQVFTTDKYTFSLDENADNSIENEMEKMGDELSALFELNDMGDQGSQSKMIATTINVGAEYKLPVYRRLSFGLLNTTRLQSNYTWTEFRLSANIKPVDAFAASANFAMGTYGYTFGWLMNLNVTGFNLFMGMDHMIMKYTPQYIPLTSNASLNLGLNIPF